jgi:four helix bundle protein
VAQCAVVALTQCNPTNCLDDFELYETARAFRRKIYSVARQLPESEKFSLNVQMRRAALSVTNNIAEGHGRWYYVDNARFCRTARGSVKELIDDLNICLDETYGDSRVVQTLKDEAYKLMEPTAILRIFVGHNKDDNRRVRIRYIQSDQAAKPRRQTTRHQTPDTTHHAVKRQSPHRHR